MKLGHWERAWGEAAMQTIFPGCAADGMPGIAGMGLGPFIAEIMAYLPFRAALGMRVAIWLVALAPLFVLGRAVSIVRLAPPDRERVVASLAASRFYFVRSLVLILKTMGALLYGGDPAVRARTMTPALPSSGVRLAVGAGAVTTADPIVEPASA
jgi:hypothetical protein